MKPVHISFDYANFDDGTGWPLPDGAFDGDDHDALGWVLRYGTPRPDQLATAAEYIAAYGALLGQTQTRRNEIARAIREAVEIHRAAVAQARAAKETDRG